MKLTTKQEGYFALAAVIAIIVVSFFNRVAAVFIGIGVLMYFAWHEFSKPGNKPRILSVNEERRQESIRSREKIMDLFSERETVSNDDVQHLLNVSDATATRYLQELENDGLIHEAGEGRGTHYRKKTT